MSDTQLGRRVYDKIVSYIRYQMTQLLSLVMLFVAATAFDINKGVALTPSMVLFLLFFATAAGVIVKLSAMDLKSFSRWYDYSRARDAMFAAADTAWAPWYDASTDVKRRGRLNIISHLLSQVPYEPLPGRDITLPRRQRAGHYHEPDLPLRHIPTPF